MQMKWQEYYRDEKLRRVIEMSLQNNRDLRIAALNVEQAHAVYGEQLAQLLPVFAASAAESKQWIPADLSGTNKKVTQKDFAVGMGLSAWEIDFFGRLQSLAEQAFQQYLASEEGRRSAQILLVSEVAKAYLLLAADREIKKLAETTLETQRAAYDLVKRRLERGLVPQLDLFRAQTQVDAARRDVVRYTQLVAQERNALDLLVGAPVPEELLPAELATVGAITEVSAGVSSEVLLDRPDVAAAEDLLKAANANIGAARAAFFPTISLTTTFGTGSSELSGLFKAGSGTWLFAPQVSMPIFAPATWAGLTLSEAQKKSAIAQYEKAIQTAFREVADALAVRGTIDQQVEAQESLVFAASETYRLSEDRYVKGVDSYLSVLDAQQDLYTAQKALVALQLERRDNQAQFYAVLGGGWQPAEPAVAKAATKPAASRPAGTASALR
jgi:multidrug efflux system outer membrane protein